jgi:hypothetical protein
VITRVVVGLALALTACSRAAAPTVVENRPGKSVRRSPGGRITADSVQSLMAHRFAAQLTAGTFALEWNQTQDDVLAELAAMGWDDLSELAAAIPHDFDLRGAHQFRKNDPANLPGLLRDFMILHDARRYFQVAWQSHWATLADGDEQLYRAYRIDLAPLEAAGVMRGDDAP